jgi:4'-phosphopantetheinyl transferase EntD
VSPEPGAALLGRLLPEWVAAEETRTDRPVRLYEAEERQIARSVPRRRAEFGTVRGCARHALERLGVPSGPLTSGPRGEPRWPAGVVGSMTHCEGYRAAAVAPAGRARAIGIDAEPLAPLPDGVLEAIGLPAERARLGAGPVPQDRLLFSAKESVYKAWFPLTGRALGFEDADITLLAGGPPDRDGLRTGTLEARLLRSAPGVPARLSGRWLAGAGVLLTAIVLPA